MSLTQEGMVIDMESAYVLASRELEDIRLANQAEMSRRHMEVCKKIPRYAEVEAQLMKNGTRLLNCILDKRNCFEEVKNSIRELQNKKAELLAANGFEAGYTDDIYTCTKCRDTGFVEGKRCDCLKNLIAKHIGANSNLTGFMREQTFEKFDMSLFTGQGDDQRVLRVMQTVCDTALTFAESFDVSHDNILLLGNAGTGKTFVSSCIANRALERGKTVYYQTAFRLFEIFENSKFGKDSEDASAVVKYVYDVDLLIIDDLGTEFVTQFTSAALFDIINARITAGRSTIISTNLSFETLSEMYSQRITSRFVGEYKILQTLGEDIRKIKKLKERI